MPDLGIGEGIAALGGGGLFDGLLSALGIGGAEAAGAGAGAAGLETGLATIGAGEGAAAAGAGGLADLVGTGAGLAGGTTGLEGTLLAGGAAGGIPAAIGAGGAGALGTALDFLSAPGASGFNAAALTPGIEGAAGGGAGALTPATSAALTPSGAAGTSVFDTGTSGIAGVNAGGAPAATSGVAPAGASAGSIAAPAGVTAPVDATSLATGQAAGAGAAPGAGTSSSISDLLSKAGSGAMKSLTSNPLGIALGAGGLGYNILQGQKQTANQNALTADAKAATANSQQMVQSGEALQQYLANGTLPPNYQTQVDQAIQDAKTQAISNAAQQGQNTDPTQNTALAASLAKIDASRAGMQAQVASQLFSSGSGLVGSGLQSAGLSGQLYQTLVQNDTAAAANTGKAIATLAAALNGKSNNTIGGTNIQVSAA